MKSIISINNIIDNYDNFIIDQWGVMHDGAFGFDHAFDSINILSRNKKSLFIISNTSKRSNLSYNNLTNLGFNKDLFLKVLTSGEMIWQQLNTNFFNLNPKKIAFIFLMSQKRTDF